MYVGSNSHLITTVYACSILYTYIKVDAYVSTFNAIWSAKFIAIESFGASMSMVSVLLKLFLYWTQCIVCVSVCKSVPRGYL